MATDTEYIKANDTRQKITGTLSYSGAPSNWLSGCTVLCLLKLKDSPYTAHSLTASIVSAAAGTVECLATTSGFPTVPGKYSQEWEVTFPDGNRLTFPNEDYNTLIIQSGLN